MKFTPPRGDMKLWTVLWAFIGLAGLYFGILDLSAMTLVVSFLQLAGGIGIWIGFPSSKWLLIAFFCLGILGRISGLIFHHFNPAILPGVLFLIFCLIRFIIWKPASPRSQELEEIPIRSKS